MSHRLSARLKRSEAQPESRKDGSDYNEKRNHSSSGGSGSSSVGSTSGSSVGSSSSSTVREYALLWGISKA
jgi:hypothetical protein